MSTKEQSSKPETTRGKRVVEVRQMPGEAVDATISKTVTRPEVGAASVTSYFNPLTSDVDINALAAEMSRQTKLVNDGDLARAEAMLISQAHSLDAIFNAFCGRAALNMGQNLQATETYVRMALKAQGQCRATLQTLGEIKAPRSIAFIRQANLANGPQQINNGVAPSARAETPNSTNKLLEESHGEWLDTRAPLEAGRTHPAMAAVEELDRTPQQGG
ncbi:hypothetical protein PQR33_32925 [Paraburkholderia sediminicola]|uniref:hypothetical protein n=1 Tax=Paraburkholderia sediminicola TaxID=458836 RepID=UPI0038BB5464